MSARRKTRLAKDKEKDPHDPTLFDLAEYVNEPSALASTWPPEPPRPPSPARPAGGDGDSVALHEAAQARYLNYALSVITVARPAGRPRRPQAGPAPHPLHDVAAEPDGRRQAPQVRQGRRRRDGQLPPARRRRALRDARAHGAALLAALPAGGRLGQLRLARRRQRGGHALHRVPARAHQRPSCCRRSSATRSPSGRTTTAPRPSRSSCPRSCRTCS